MDNENEELVNRALYKQIKSMNRAEMETFVRNVFAQGYRRAEEETHPHVIYNSKYSSEYHHDVFVNTEIFIHSYLLTVTIQQTFNCQVYL